MVSTFSPLPAMPRLTDARRGQIEREALEKLRGKWSVEVREAMAISANVIRI